MRSLKTVAATLFFILICLCLGRGSESREEANPTSILVEVWLSPENRKDADAIKQKFQAVSITNVRFQFFRAGRPPVNIAIGRDVPSSIARLSFDLAIRYNRGIHYLIPDVLLPANYIAIGTSAFDETRQIPITQENFKELSDPGLATEQFHQLYHTLSRIPGHSD